MNDDKRTRSIGDSILNLLDDIFSNISLRNKILIPILILATILVRTPLLESWYNHFKFVASVYFTQNRLNLISNIVFILIGIYATITSVFGSSRSVVTSAVAKYDLTGQYIGIISTAIIASFSLVFYIIFLPMNIMILIDLIIWTFFNLIEFLVLIIAMYYYNVKNSKEADRVEKEKYDKLMAVLTIIKNGLERDKE